MKTDLNTQIPKTIEEKLSKHSQQFGINMKELKTELLENLPQVKEEFPKLSLDKQLLIAYRALTTRLAQEEGGLKSKAIVHTGFFIGETGIKDEALKKINKIRRMKPEEQRTFHPDENTWLDYKDGDNYLKPITPIEHRTFYGFGSSGKELDPKRSLFMKFDLWKESVRTIVPSHGDLYSFRANPRESTKQLPFYNLGASTATKLRAASEQLTDDQKYAIIKGSNKDIFTIADVETIYDTRFKRDPDSKVFQEQPEPVLIEASVTSSVIREEKNNIVNLYDETDDGLKYATAYIPHYLPMKFKDGDRVLFLASLGELTFSGNTEPTVVMYVKGFFVVPIDAILQQYV
jgi:hypothetical protein